MILVITLVHTIPWWYIMLQANLSTTASPIGSYVTYKGLPYLVVDTNDTVSMVKILNPIQGNNKLHVSIKNIVQMNCNEAQCVELHGHKYLVTAKSNIISLRTGRLVYTMACDNHRKAILSAVA